MENINIIRHSYLPLTNPENFLELSAMYLNCDVDQLMNNIVWTDSFLRFVEKNDEFVEDKEELTDMLNELKEKNLQIYLSL